MGVHKYAKYEKKKNQIWNIDVNDNYIIFYYVIKYGPEKNYSGCTNSKNYTILRENITKFRWVFHVSISFNRTAPSVRKISFSI